MSSLSDESAARCLQAAGLLFARHGYQRTSMADVAAEALVSRATLYLRFSDKRALFDAVAASVVAEALSAAEAAWRADAGLAANLAATILAKDLPLFRLLHAGPHGADLLAADAELTRDHARRLADGTVALLTRRAGEAAMAGAALDLFDGAAGFAQFLGAASAGVKHEAGDESAYCEAVLRLCRVTARAMEPR